MRLSVLNNYMVTSYLGTNFNTCLFLDCLMIERYFGNLLHKKFFFSSRNQHETRFNVSKNRMPFNNVIRNSLSIHKYSDRDLLSLFASFIVARKNDKT